jgi:transposase
VAIAFAKEGADVAIVYLNEHTDARETVRLVEQGSAKAASFLADVTDPDEVAAMLRPALLGLARLLGELEREIAVLDKQLLEWHRNNEISRRLASIPGLGPLTSSALAARVLQPQRFGSARDFSAWLGLVPRQNSSGGKVRLGSISKKGDGYLRRLLVNGAQALLNSKRAKADPWIARLLASKPRLVAAVALANKLARIAWAVMVGNTTFHAA